MKALQMFQKMRRMPMFPLMPLLPMGLLVSSVVLLALVYRRVGRLEEKTDRLVRIYTDIALS